MCHEILTKPIPSLLYFDSNTRANLLDVIPFSYNVDAILDIRGHEDGFPIRSILLS